MIFDVLLSKYIHLHNDFYYVTGYLSPGGVPYIDSHSTSSGTSDMSDYIETLSMSSYSSSDTPDSFQLVIS